jgi:hypothetical protein
MPLIAEHRDNPRAVTYDANSAEHDRSDIKATAGILVSNS